MALRPSDVETLIREGFGLLLELRRHPEARRLAVLANAYLRMLLQQEVWAGPPLIVSVKAVPLRRR